MTAKRTVSLGGRCVVPGFHDAHKHMAWFGATLDEVDLRVPTLDALYDAVAARAADAPEGAGSSGTGTTRTRSAAILIGTCSSGSRPAAGSC